MSLFKWSRIAATNATADSTVNYAEGQAPSSVNDFARAAMAAVAKYRDDIAGAITTGGTSTAYTLTSYQTFDSLANMSGHMVAFTPHTTNGATVTLSVDGLGAKPLRSAPSTELLAGVLVQGTPYAATYYNATQEWNLQGFLGFNPYAVPLGAMLPYTGSTAPNSNFVFPYGQAISRTTYAGYFSLVGATYGVGDGSTTFNVPDLRGRVAAGKDDMGGSAASKIGTIVTDDGTIVGTTLGSKGGSATHAQITAELAQHSHGITDPQHSHSTGSALTGTGGTFTFTAGGAQATTTTGAQSTGITINNAGSSQAMAWLQPTIILNFILRVL